MEPKDKRILLAEADPIFGDVAEAFLTSRGYAPVRLRDGRRALDALTRERFDAAIVGLELPGLDGLEVAACAALLPSRPPVVLTTREPGLEKAPIDTLGIAALVVRPCRLDALVEVIEEVARRGASAHVTRSAAQAPQPASLQSGSRSWNAAESALSPGGSG